MSASHCLIFEPDVTGHRLQHVRHLADALLEIGCQVTLALQSDCRDHAEYRVHVAALEPRVNVHAALDPHQSLSLRARQRRVRELTTTIEVLNPDWVYVPFGDATTQLAGLESLLLGSVRFRRVPIEAQIMRGKYGYPTRSVSEKIGAAANRFLVRQSPWQVTHFLDPFAFNALKPLPNEKSFRLIPEPVESLPAVDQHQARETLGIPTEGRYLAFVGGLHPQKGIEQLVASFARAKVANNDRLLCVGKMAPAIREMFQREYDALIRQGRILLVDRYVSDHELGCGFLAADVVAVAHPRQIGSSGTLVRGAAAKRFVLASDFGWIGWATKTFRLGTTVNVLDADAYAIAIANAFEKSSRYQPDAASERFCQYHTVANQKAHWVAEIGRERGISLSALPERIDWSWVLEAADR